MPPASASAPEEAGTAGSTTRTTTTRCSLMGMYLRESFDHLRSTFAAAATLDGAAYSWLKPEPQRKLLVPKMLVPRASSLSSFSSSTSSSPLNSTPPAWSFVGLEHWLEDSYHPAVFENGFLRRARTIWRGPSAGSGSTEEKGVPVVPALLGCSGAARRSRSSGWRRTWRAGRSRCTSRSSPCPMTFRPSSDASATPWESSAASSARPPLLPPWWSRPRPLRLYLSRARTRYLGARRAS